MYGALHLATKVVMSSTSTNHRQYSYIKEGVYQPIPVPVLVSFLYQITSYTAATLLHRFTFTQVHFYKVHLYTGKLVHMYTCSHVHLRTVKLVHRYTYTQVHLYNGTLVH